MTWQVDSSLSDVAYNVVETFDTHYRSKYPEDSWEDVRASVEDLRAVLKLTELDLA